MVSTWTRRVGFLAEVTESVSLRQIPINEKKCNLGYPCTKNSTKRIASYKRPTNFQQAVKSAPGFYAMLLGIPDMKTAIKDGWGPAQIIDANFGNAFSTVFLLTVAAAIFVCCLAIMTATIMSVRGRQISA